MEYMSQEGYDKLVAELRHMEQVELPAVREAIAEALLNKRVGDEVEVHVPAGLIKLRIESVTL